MSFARQASGLVLLGSLVSGCGGQKTEPTNPSVAANQRLQGQWRLLSFRPNLALEAPLQGLLDAQQNTLNITFDNGQFTAAGAGVQTGGRYEITSASGDTLTGRIYDSAGAGYGISGRFVASQFQFTSTDSPWAGTGVLERSQP
jgi:hypothetical protein